MTKPTPRLRLLDASVRLDSMPVDGRRIVVAPTEEERAAIAAQLGLLAVETLHVTLDAVKFRGGMRVTGQLLAAIKQPSVVTLEPVHQDIAEPIDRIFLPAGEKDFARAGGAEVFVDLDGEDVPDHFEGNEADLTDLIVESLALAVDLYPREPGVTLDDLGLKLSEPEENPFAVLKALKDKDI